MPRNRHNKPTTTTCQKLPVVSQICDIIEIWQIIKEYGRKPTCDEEIGWPDWRQWF